MAKDTPQIQSEESTVDQQTTRPPRVSARSRGLYNTMLGTAATQFRANNPGKEVRFVRAPEDKSDRSQLIKRRAEGYDVVSAEQCGIDAPHGLAGDQVRVGDTILMAIDKDVLEENRADVQADIRRETQRVKDAFVASLKDEAPGGHTSEPIGTITTNFEEREIKLREKT
jgi:hypothetical protein